MKKELLELLETLSPEELEYLYEFAKNMFSS